MGEKYIPETLMGKIAQLLGGDDKTVAGWDVTSSTLNTGSDAIPVVGNIAGAVISAGDVGYNIYKYLKDPSASNLTELGFTTMGILPGFGNVKDAKAAVKATEYLLKNTVKAGPTKAIKNTLVKRKVGKPKARFQNLNKKGEPISSIRVPEFDHKNPVIYGIGTIGNWGYSGEDIYSSTSELFE